MHVREPWLSEMAAGRKTVEGRAGPASKFQHMIGKRITFFNNTGAVAAKVVAVRHYADLHTYLASELQAAAPQFATREEALNAYHEFYPDSLIKERGGICAIQVVYV